MLGTPHREGASTHKRKNRSKKTAPPTAAQAQSKRPLAIIRASASHHSKEFNLPLFCNWWAGIDICSPNMARLHGFRSRYEGGSNRNIYNVSGNNIQIIGYTIIYLHSGKIRKPL